MIVDLLPNEDQTMIVDSLRGMLSGSFPVERLHDEGNLGGASERNGWGEIVGLGLVGLGLSADNGGVGYSLIEEALAAREYGRNLISLSVIASMGAVHVAAAAGRDDIVQALIAGEARAACTNALGSLDGDSVEVQLLDATDADYALVWNASNALLVPLGDHVSARRLVSIDDAVSLDRATLPLASALRADGRVSARMGLLLAAYQVGIANATREMAVEYAKVREQFGQPIGAFQGIKFACADMAVREEAAFAQVFFAAVTDQTPGGVLDTDLGSARLLANQAAIENAKANIQTHGAMGFTFECDAHFYLKRANLLAAVNGSKRADQIAILA